MKIITESEAEILGYRSITTDVDPRKEADIFMSIESTLNHDNAVWIKQKNGMVQAARKQSKLTPTTAKKK